MKQNSFLSPHSLNGADANPFKFKNDKYLPVPKTDKVWLKSPPGSPPLDWKTSEEEAPNKMIHHPEDEYDSVPLTKGHPAIIVEDYSDHLKPLPIIEMPLQHKSLVFTSHNPIPQTRLPPADS